MAVYVGLEMSTDTALKLLKFIAQQNGGDPDLCSLLSDIERQIKQSICTNLNTYRALCIKNRRIDQHSLLRSISFLIIFCLREVDFLSTRTSTSHGCIGLLARIYSIFL